MTNFDQVDKVSAQVIGDLEKNNKKLDILVENAGVSMRCEFVDYAF